LLREYKNKSEWIALKKFVGLTIMQYMLSYWQFTSHFLVTLSLLVEFEELMQQPMDFTIAISRRD
jgi:hypothetical protein